MACSTKRCAVVTGANKGIGFAICKGLASKGILVVLTARDEKRGLEAVEKLKDSEPGLSQNVIFHKLDVTDPASIASLQEFTKAKFGKPDILESFQNLNILMCSLGSKICCHRHELHPPTSEESVNNAGVGGTILDAEALRDSDIGKGKVDWSKIATETYELTEECLEINYYGAKRMVDAFIPLLELSDSPRIVNVSASMGKLKHFPNGWGQEVLSNVETLTEEKVDVALKKYLKDFKEGSLETNGWPGEISAYTVSKAAMNAYTRVLARKYPSFCINCVCPGFVKTDINYNTGFMTPDQGAQGPVRLALLPEGGPSGRFFVMTEESSF